MAPARMVNTFLRNTQTHGNGCLCLIVLFIAGLSGSTIRSADTQLCYLIPPLRKIVWERASSLTIDPNYRVLLTRFAMI